MLQYHPDEFCNDTIKRIMPGAAANEDHKVSMSPSDEKHVPPESRHGERLLGVESEKEVVVVMSMPGPGLEPQSTDEEGEVNMSPRRREREQEEQQAETTKMLATKRAEGQSYLRRVVAWLARQEAARLPLVVGFKAKEVRCRQR